MSGRDEGSIRMQLWLWLGLSISYSEGVVA